MQAVGQFNSRLAGRTLAWDRKKRADFTRTSKLVANLKVADLEDRLMDLPDDFVFRNFHHEGSRDRPLVSR